MTARLWRPEVFQGSRRKRSYFEGWYWKLVTADLGESWAFIPGMALGKRPGEGYAFIQAIEGGTGQSWWFEFPLSEFRASTDELRIHVGRNSFSEEGMHLELRAPEASFTGELGFHGITRPASPPWAPGVMGPFSFVPFMECSHGLVSLHHGLSGSIEVGGADGARRSVDFSGGRGYAEKDWGTSMPRSWIWTQSNNFPEEGDSFMLSIARIPWLGSAFTGFLCVGSLGGRLVREATWTGARIESLGVGESLVEAVIARRKLRIEVGIERSRIGILRGPERGLLSRRIAESVDALLHVRLSGAGKLLFEGAAPKAGLEVVGDPATLVPAGKPA